MVGYTELLQKHAAPSLDEKGRRYMTTILDSTKRMGTLIDDLLSFSRIARTETRETTVSLQQLVKEVREEIQPETSGRDIAWKVGELPELRGDRAMLRLALVNLISNAVKFTRKRRHAEIEIGLKNRVALRTELPYDLPSVFGDRIQLQQLVLNLIMNGIESMTTVTDRPRELAISTHDGATEQVLVSVRDSGIGLDPQSSERMFEAFYTTKPHGMGMGLSISRSIVKNHGGRLWAVPNEGAGATFQFTVPRYK